MDKLFDLATNQSEMVSYLLYLRELVVKQGAEIGGGGGMNYFEKWGVWKMDKPLDLPTDQSEIVSYKGSFQQLLLGGEGGGMWGH